MSSYKQIRDNINLLYRRYTSPFRSLPDFIIVGAQKCGTSSLYRYLALHPQVIAATKKEVHYFDCASYDSGVSWYKAHFPANIKINLKKKKCGSQIITGESSPYYLFYPHSPSRIAELIPNVKIIVMLRNPVDRAFSHYYHQKRKEREDLSFEEAIKCETDRLEGEEKKILRDASYYSYNYWAYSYLARGRYVEQIEKWLEIYLRSQLYFMSSEKFFENTALELRNVYRFLELKPHELSEYKKLNAGVYKSMSDNTRQMLLEYFEPHNQKLFKLLDLEYDWSK